MKTCSNAEVRAVREMRCVIDKFDCVDLEACDEDREILWLLPALLSKEGRISLHRRMPAFRHAKSGVTLSQRELTEYGRKVQSSQGKPCTDPFVAHGWRCRWE